MGKRFKYTRNPIIDSDPMVHFRQSLKRLADTLPEDKAVYIYTKHKQDFSLSYKQFYQNIRGFSTALKEEGLAGQAVAVVGETAPYYMTTYYATVIAGGVIVPLDKDITDEEMAGFIRNAEAKAIVYGEDQNERIKRLKELLPDIRFFLPAYPDGSEEPNERFMPFEQFTENGKKAYDAGNHFFDEVPQDLEKCCAIIFTSGTTGTSKGVMLSQKNLVSAIMASADVIDQLNSETVLMSVLPMHHTYEVTTDQMTGQFIGATIAINDSLKYVSRNIKKYRPTYLVLVPLFVETMHKKMWEEIRKKGMEKKVRFAMKLSNALLAIGIDIRKKLFGEILEAYGGRLDAIVSGGAKLNPQCIKDFRAIGVEVQEGYGITECSPLLAANPINKNKPGSVGPAVKDVTVRIAEDGEIIAKGPNVMLGYYKNPEATKAVFTEDGYFRTGDIGHLDKDGYIYITGRKKNIIILSNGENIYPEELEERLAGNELFAEWAVVGRNKENGVVITAVIYPDYTKFAGKSKEEIEAAIKEELNNINRSLPQYKQMRGLEIRETEFEKTTSRKIKRYKI